MRRQKTFTTLAVLCLALGIGANTTIFSLMDSILFRELPVEAPDELVILQWTARAPVEGVPWAVPSRGGLVAVDSRLRGDSWPYPMFASFDESRVSCSRKCSGANRCRSCASTTVRTDG